MACVLRECGTEGGKDIGLARVNGRLARSGSPSVSREDGCATAGSAFALPGYGGQACLSRARSRPCSA